MDEKGNSGKIINKADLILIISILIIGIVAFTLIKIFRKPGLNVAVRVDGEVVKELSLDKSSTYKFKSKMGQNTIVVKDGSVYVTEADCPDKICEEYKPISKVGEAIICLPHKLVVEIVE